MHKLVEKDVSLICRMVAGETPEIIITVLRKIVISAFSVF